MRGKNKQKGITLIALVITIIVLLILAGVSIAMLSGENGILGQANNSKIEQSHGAVKEGISLAYNEWQILRKTSDNTKISSTDITTIQGIEVNQLAETTEETIDISSFMAFLQSKEYVDDTGVIDVEKLTGSKQALGNGEGSSDVYKIEIESGNYVIRYYENETSNEIISQINRDSSKIDWEEIFANAKKPEGQTSEDIGIDSNGELVNMDNWIAVTNGNDGIQLVGSTQYGSHTMSSKGYIGEIKDGKIVGEIPAYVKKVGTDEFLQVTSLANTFEDCTELIEVPKIPSSVTDMYATFSGCTSLEQVQEIPSSVTNMGYTFYGCTSLEQAPEIPNSVTNMEYTFSGCTNLTQIANIPDSVTTLYSTFEGCTSLKQAPKIPNSITDMSFTFSGCTSLEQVPEIPSSVTDMSSTFSECTSLKQVPEIPNSITDMGSTFSGCTNLTQIANISDSVTNLYSTFEGCTSLKQAPKIPNSVTDMTSTFSGCTSLEQAPEIPSSVTDMQSTFNGCTSLEQVPEIPSSVRYMNSTFEGCSNLTGELVINANIWGYEYRYCLQDATTNDECNLVLSGSSPQLAKIYETRSTESHITCPQLDGE